MSRAKRRVKRECNEGSKVDLASNSTLALGAGAGAGAGAARRDRAAKKVGRARYYLNMLLRYPYSTWCF